MPEAVKYFQYLLITVLLLRLGTGVQGSGDVIRPAQVDFHASDLNQRSFAWAGMVELVQTQGSIQTSSEAPAAAVDETALSGSDGKFGSAQGASDRTAAPSRTWGFLRLGIRHIWTGYDHLLFLLGLLVVCRTFRSIVTIISCFTLAHSLTLVFATFSWVNLPPRIVEPAIAASIVFVGLENLVRRGEELRTRAAITFGFGLLHGFGFANVLRDLGVGLGETGIAMPLLAFNAGVEIGQVLIACAVLPLLWQLRKSEAFTRRGVPVASGLVAAIGLYWFLLRTVGR
jgi:hydrogenase/urease accessory protein HupE